MTFILHASKEEEVVSTIRLSVIVAVAKGRALAKEGWQVSIEAPNGIRYASTDFEKLLSSYPIFPPPS